MTTLQLPGLKGHHPLGFLAACGLARCCEQWNGFGKTALNWGTPNGSSFTAVLHCQACVDVVALTRMLNHRAEQQRESPALTWSSKIDDREKYRKAATAVLDRLGQRDATDVLATFAALASDIVMDPKGQLRPTMLDLTSGNQRFLSSIRVLAGEPTSKAGKPHTFSEDTVREALLGPWQYRDVHHSLGWDPQTQRLHALHHKLPEKDKENRSVRLAVYLASEAISLFPCSAVDGKLRTIGFHHHDGGDWFAWPVWRDPISVDALRSLLSLPVDKSLKNRGVEAVYRCHRIRTGGSEGNYQIFSHAQEWLV